MANKTRIICFEKSAVTGDKSKTDILYSSNITVQSLQIVFRHSCYGSGDILLRIDGQCSF